MIDNVETILRDASRLSLEILTQLSTGASPRLEAMVTAIRDNFCMPRYSVKQLKKDARVDFRHVKLFRAAFGVHPSRLIRECRMETAMVLLRDTLLAVEDIAILVGFDSVRSLERLCRRWCGLSPAELRAQLRRSKRELAALPDQVFSWYSWEQYLCQSLSDEVLEVVIEYLEGLYAASA